MMKAIMLAVLVVAGACLSTYTYSFNQNAQGTDWKPLIDLTGLTAGDVITFDLYFFLDTGFSPTNFLLQMKDATGSSISPQPTGFSTSTPISFNTTTTFTWTVPTSGNYMLAGYGFGSFLSLVPYYINITNSNGNSLTTRVGILRPNELYQNIYIGNATNIAITCTGCGSFTLLQNLVPASFYLGGAVSPSSSVSNTKTYNALSAGYYIIVMSASSAGTITY